MADFVKVASVSEIAEGACIAAEVGDEQVMVVKLDGEVYAYGDLCPHAELPLSEGGIEDGQVECPWHGSLFDVKTGENTGPPASEGLQRYEVRLEGDDVLVGPSE